MAAFGHSIHQIAQVQVEHKPFEQQTGDAEPHTHDTGHLKGRGDLVKSNHQVHEQGHHRNQFQDVEDDLHVLKNRLPHAGLAPEMKDKKRSVVEKERGQNAIQQFVGRSHGVKIKRPNVQNHAQRG